MASYCDISWGEIEAVVRDNGKEICNKCNDTENMSMDTVVAFLREQGRDVCSQQQVDITFYIIVLFVLMYCAKERLVSIWSTFSSNSKDKKHIRNRQKS